MSEATGSCRGQEFDRRIVVVDGPGCGRLRGARRGGAGRRPRGQAGRGGRARPAGPGRRAARGRGRAGRLAAPRARHRHWRYQVAEDALELRHGVVRRIHSAIPYFRVQHIDVAQGPVERAVGLARLIVHTALAGTDATIPGIAAGDADGLRRLILARAGSGDAVRGSRRRRGVGGARGWGPRRLHILSPVFFAGRHAWRLWPLALLLAARQQWWLLALGALVLLAWSSIEWLRRTYALEGGALRLEEGVLSRQLRAVPFDRIQQVDLVRKPLHRLLGVATLRVETAGGGRAAEVDLDVVTLAEAQALRASLLRAKARLAATPTGAPGQVAAGQASVDEAELVEAALRPSGCCCGCGSAR